MNEKDFVQGLKDIGIQVSNDIVNRIASESRQEIDFHLVSCTLVWLLRKTSWIPLHNSYDPFLMLCTVNFLHNKSVGRR